MYVLPELPYAYDALAPVISAQTLHAHHDKHHRTYVEKTNELAAKAGLTGRPLEELVREARRRGETKLFNNAAQAWNHAFFWRCMTPEGDAAPDGALARAIDAAFGDFEAFKDAFVEEGFNHFGSGWAWLVTGSDGLKVITTHDADDTLVREGSYPLLVCDLWEHAYYLDFQNDRKRFLERWVAGVADFRFAAAQLAAADGKGEGFQYPAPQAGADGREASEAPRPNA